MHIAVWCFIHRTYGCLIFYSQYSYTYIITAILFIDSYSTYKVMWYFIHRIVIQIKLCGSLVIGIWYFILIGYL